MNYELNKPPIGLPCSSTRFAALSKPDLLAYAEWFHDSTPGRVSELARAVRNTPGHERWSSDFEPASLSTLERWFEGKVTTRERTASELESISQGLLFPVKLQTWDLADETYSLVLDVAMYLSQVVLRTMPGTRWVQRFNSKRSVDYGQPVISGLGRVCLNPVQSLMVAAHRAVDTKSVGLVKMYEYWSAAYSTATRAQR